MSTAPRPSHRIPRMALGVLVGLLVVEGAARIALTATPDAVRWYDASTQLKIEQMDDIGDVDIVFAGTSMAWQAFVPETFDAGTGTGITSYNAGLNGGTPAIMERWLLEEVVPRTNPDTVIWGLSSLDLAPEYGDVERAAYDDALATRSGALAEIERAVGGWSALVANRTVLRSIDDMFGAGADQRDLDYDNARRTLGAGGERLEFRSDTSARAAAIAAARLRDFRADPADLDRIRRTVLGLQDRGIDVVLVELPVPDRFVAAHPNGAADHDLVGSALDELADRLGVRFLQMTEGFHDDDFVDFTHLDAAAAADLSRQLATAWASDRDDRGTTGPIATPAGQPDDPRCRTRVVIDDYGFEVEIEECTEPGDDPTPDEPAVEDPREIYLAALADRFLTRRCDDLVRDLESPPEILEGAPERELGEALNGLREAREECGSAASQLRWSDAVTHLEAAAGIDRPVVDPSSPTETASRSVAAIDALRGTLFGRPLVASGRAWYHTDEIQTSLVLRERAAAGDPIDVIAIGSSETLNALHQPMLDAAFGGDFYNMGMPGGDPDEWEVLFPRIFDGVPLPSRVFWGVTPHRLLEPPGTDCTHPTIDSTDISVQFRAGLFPDLTPQFSMTELLLGPDLATSPVRQTPAYSVIDTRFLAPGHLRYYEETFTGVPESELRYPGAIFCPEAIESMRRVIADLEAAGMEVTIVVLPLHPDVAAEAPEAHAAAQAAVDRMLVQDELDVIDISVPYLDVETNDGWHATEVGRIRVTTDLIAALGLGPSG